MESRLDEAVASPEQKSVTVRTWAVLTEAGALSSVAVLPCLLALQKDALAAANAKRAEAGKRPITPPMIAGLTYLQSHVTFGVAAGLGLRAARTMGLGTPHLSARLRGRPSRLQPSQVAGYAAAGASAGLLTAALDYTLFRRVHEQLAQSGIREPAAWRGALATLYGAIGEETLLRLGLQTLLVAGLRRLRGETVTPAGATMWPAIALSNVAFGAGHLPAVKSLTSLTPAVITRTITLNAVPGTVFGYLYWKRGLEAAMIAHGAADIVLHVGGAMLQRPGKTD